MKKGLTKNKSTLENREYWAGVEETSAKVRKWPEWKRRAGRLLTGRESGCNS